MRILVLHSDVPAGAPPDEQGTLRAAAAVEAALRELGHEASCAAFAPDPGRLAAQVRRHAPELIFNLVESVWGRGRFESMAALMLADLEVPHTGAPAAALAASSDKLLVKRLLRSAGLPTPDWSAAPGWPGLDARRWIVKAVGEDASLGLDDGAVACGRDAVLDRARASAARHGGRWFAEAFVEGREFNVTLLERDGEPVVQPVGEILFEREAGRPRIVSYAAKWHESAADYRGTTRDFGWQRTEPKLGADLAALAQRCWSLLGLHGYARVDFRVDAAGQPFILEVNPNPCLEPDAGAAAACAEAGLSYRELIAAIVAAALER